MTVCRVRHLRLLLIPAAVFLCSCTSFYRYREYNVALNAPAARAERPAARGEYEKAIALYAAAAAAYETDRNELGMLLCLERIGWLQREIGQYGDALDTFRKAIPLGRRLNGNAAEIDADMGDAYMFSGDFERARDHYEKALDALKTFEFKTSYSRPPSRDDVCGMIRQSKAFVHSHVNLGTLNYFARDYDKAIRELEAANGLIEKVNRVERHWFYGRFIRLTPDFKEGVGFCETMMAACYSEKGEFDKARLHFETGRKVIAKGGKQYALLVNEALALKSEFRASGKKNDPVLLARSNRFLEKAERYGAVDIVWRMCFEIGRALVKDNARTEARAYLARSVDALELTRSRLREDSVKQMFAASVQDVYAAMISLCADMDLPEEGFDYLERAKARAFLDMLGGRSVKAAKSVDPALAARAADLQNRVELVERRLRLGSESDRAKAREEYVLALKERKTVMEDIKAQSLEFAAASTVATVPVRRIAGRLDDTTALLSFFLDEHRVIIWVLRRDKVQTARAAIAPRDLAELVSDYRESVTSRQEEFRRELGRRLAAVLLEPVKAQLAGATHLLIVPSGPLHALPFACLPSPAAPDRFLVQDAAVTILPNASSLFYVKQGTAAGGHRFFAVGNPKRGDPDLPSLPFAEKEVEALAPLFADKTVLVGAQATETAFKTAPLSGVDFIHLAAHGKFNSRQPLASAILLAGDEKNDGNLETFEIFSLNLNPRLIVLSACQSGVGRVQGGDEVQGLNRAFLYAGAGGVVASLWNVSDQATGDLMKAFYGALQKQKAPEALRSAQMEMIRQNPLPFFWAPFYLTGGSEL